MSKNFIELTLGNHIVIHGFSDNNEEISSEHKLKFSKKLVAISRIKSISEKYILIDYLDGRWIYWEYQESYEEIKNKLA